MWEINYNIITTIYKVLFQPLTSIEVIVGVGDLFCTTILKFGVYFK